MTDKHSSAAQEKAILPQRQPRSLPLRILRNSIRVIVYLPLLLLVVLALLIGTSFGSRISVMLADAFVPNLEISYHSGRLNKDLTLAEAHWSMDGINVHATDLHLAWFPACLVHRQLCVNQLTASSVSVDIDTNLLSTGGDKPKPETDDSAPDTPLELPFTISLNNSDLRQVKVRVNDMHFNADALSAAADWPTSGIRVHKLNTKGLLVDIPLGLDDSPKKVGKQPPPTPTKQHDAADWAMAHLPKAYNPVPVTVEDLQLQESTLILGTRTDKFSELSLKGDYLGTDIHVQQLHAVHTMGSLSLKGNIRLDEHYPMALSAQAQLKPNSLLKGLGREALKLNIHGDFADLKLQAQGQGDTEFTLSAGAALANPQLPYQLELSADALRWPLNAPEYQGRRLNLQSSGDLIRQSAVVSGDILTPYYPQAQFASELSHTGSQLTLKHLQLVAGESSLHLSGNIDYGLLNANRPLQLDWNVALNGKQLDPSLVILPGDNPLPKGRITADIVSAGKLSGKDWQIRLPNLLLYGLLDGYPLDLSGGLSVDSKLHFDANALKLSALGASLTADGSTGENWDLNGQLMVPDLSPWMKDAKGSIKADLKVTGKEDDPRLTLDGEMNQVGLNDIEVSRLAINGWLDLHGQHDYNLAVGGESLSFDANTIKTLTLRSQGNLNQQQLSLTTQGDLHLDTRIDSQYDDKKQNLAADISKLNMATLLGQWQLDKPVSVNWNIAQHKGQISPFCLLGQDNQLCLEETALIGNKGQAAVSFKGDPGAIAAPLMPPQLKWHGPVMLDSRIFWQPGSRPSANILLQLMPGSITVTRKEQPPATVEYHGGQVASLLKDDLLTLNAEVDAGSLAALSSRLQISVQPDRKLSGNIRIDHLQLAGLQVFTPQIETLSGKLASDIALSGSLSRPRIEGKLTLSKGSFAAAANPTLMEDVNLAVNFGGQQVALSGDWRMGKGMGRLGGELNWQQGKANGTVTIKGDNLEVIAPPVAIVRVSPDLTIALSPNATHVTGNITVPDGDIKIVQMAAGGVPLSSDVVFQDSISEAAVKSKPYPISADLNIKVADQVSISGMGLSGNLAGTLTLQQQPSRPPLLFGEVQVVNGAYRFLGQRLQISTGELQFVGPVAEPNLNIEAVRLIKDENGDVTAGIRVTGTPARPQVTLFSNPAMEQAEILSYIIKGSGFNGKQQNDALMMSAALTLSNQLADGAIGNIGNAATSLAEKIGISDIQLDANDDGKVAISGYIGDRLMVKYGIGVFNPGYELTVRYYLLTRLYLEAVSGTLDQSLDLYYSFDLN
ncbi:MAG: translocation/assembly module TamB domain-containing protein [Shewanella sp.]|nr:translocation/assembly module TamB domain-containing protein [Shewanella sp.]MCF1431509.1 translocation/assembly module TamB domain-containing protein [Shewanella sp.]